MGSWTGTIFRCPRWNSFRRCACRIAPCIAGTTMRIAQVRRDVMLRSENAQVVAEAFAKANLVNDEDAVHQRRSGHAAGHPAEDGTVAGRKGVTGN